MKEAPGGGREDGSFSQAAALPGAEKTKFNRCISRAPSLSLT